MSVNARGMSKMLQYEIWKKQFEPKSGRGMTRYLSLPLLFPVGSRSFEEIESAEREVMSARNDKCLCGSGLKSKNCHDRVNDDSYLSHLLNKMSFFDQEYSAKKKETKAKPICKEGCHTCCAAYFHVSPVEYSAIRKQIETQFPERMDEYKNRAIEQMSYLEKNYKQNYDKLLKSKEVIPLSKITDLATACDQLGGDMQDKPFPACIFVNVETGHCDVYQSRPFICRFYSISSSYPGRCARLERKTRTFGRISNRKSSRYLVDIEYDQRYFVDVDWIADSKCQKFLSLSSRPLFDWFSQPDRFTPLFNSLTAVTKDTCNRALFEESARSGKDQKT